MKLLEGKTAIVTGGARGIGKAIVTCLAENGAKAAVLDIEDEAGAETVKELNEITDAIYVHCDVSKVPEIKASFEKCVEHFGGVDIMINNAGIPVRYHLSEFTEEIFDFVVAVNMKSTFFFSQLLAEHVKERGTGYGRIVNLASIRAKMFDYKHSGYSITKEGVVSVTKCFAVGYGKYGITSNAIGPAMVITPMTAHYLDDPGAVEKINAISPIGRAILPEEIANLALFFARPDSGAINGQIVYADGGGTRGDSFA